MSAKTKGKPKSRKEHEWRRVSLIIAGKYLDPQKVVDILHIEPDRWGKLGEQYRKNRKCKQGFWQIGNYPSTWHLETQIKSIINRISPVRQKLKKFIQEDTTVREAYLTIAFAPMKGNANPCYAFDAELLNEITSLGIKIVLSIQIIGEWEKIFAEVEKASKKTSKKHIPVK